MHQILAQIVVKLVQLELFLINKLLHVIIAQLELFLKMEPLFDQYAQQGHIH